MCITYFCTLHGIALKPDLFHQREAKKPSNLSKPNLSLYQIWAFCFILNLCLSFLFFINKLSWVLFLWIKAKSEVYVAEPSPEPFSPSLKTPRNFLLGTMWIPILPCPLPEVNCLYARCPRPHTGFPPKGHLFTHRWHEQYFCRAYFYPWRFFFVMVKFKPNLIITFASNFHQNWNFFASHIGLQENIKVKSNIIIYMLHDFTLVYNFALSGIGFKMIVATR